MDKCIYCETDESYIGANVCEECREDSEMQDRETRQENNYKEKFQKDWRERFDSDTQDLY
mgnify:CR=1 FL=1